MVSTSLSSELATGLYDLVLCQILEEQVASLQSQQIETESEPLDPGDSHTALTAHLRQLLHRASRDRQDFDGQDGILNGPGRPGPPVP